MNDEGESREEAGEPFVDSSRASNELLDVLDRSRAGDPAATEELIPLLYDELRALARSLLSRQRPGHTLQATALVHEAWLRLGGGARQRPKGEATSEGEGEGEEEASWNGRGHFFAAAARAMRHILVDQARRKNAQKRGGGQQRVAAELEPSDVPVEPPGDDVLAVDEALRKLEQAAPRKAEVVQLRYFGGLTLEETAEALGVSHATVEREWRYARAWLYRELGGE